MEKSPRFRKRLGTVDLSIVAAVFGAMALGFWVVGDAKAAAWCAAPGALVTLLAVWTTEKA